MDHLIVYQEELVALTPLVRSPLEVWHPNLVSTLLIRWGRNFPIHDSLCADPADTYSSRRVIHGALLITSQSSVVCTLTGIKIRETISCHRLHRNTSPKLYSRNYRSLGNQEIQDLPGLLITQVFVHLGEGTNIGIPTMRKCWRYWITVRFSFVTR